MENPRLYFSIHKEGYLLPIRTQSRELDTAFASRKVIEANMNNYNKYTNNFIEKNKKNGDIYWATDYEFYPDTFIFNFNSINICNDEDFERMSSEPCEFDSYTEYKFSNASTNTATNVENSDTIVNQIRTNIPCPSVDETGFYVDEKKWCFINRNIKKHINTMLIGPTGTGKTDIVQRVCKSQNIELSIFDMGAMQDPITGLLGCRDLVESKNGTSISTFNYSRFVDAIQKPGVILLDELSRAPQEALNILFPCLDNRRMLFADVAPTNMMREIPVHPECTFIATANIGDEYTGTSELDAALVNRFLPLQLDYLPEKFEVNVVNVRTGLNEASSRKIVAFVNKIRGEYASGNISKTVSTRETLAIAELVVDGFSIVDSIDFVITNKFMNNSFNDEATYIKKLIMGF